MTESVDVTLEEVVRRYRLVVIGALAVVVGLSWIYLLAGAGMETTIAAVWTPGYAVLMFFMWWIMMVAMMLPSAAPMILLFATVNRKQREARQPHVATSIFALAYLIAWAGFSLLAVIVQWLFEYTGNLSQMLVGTNEIFGGGLLITAGIYQLTPVKHACLRNCRSPHTFLGINWQQGNRGALRMGLKHGAFCVGCCWLLMGLLFFGGVMNLYWIAGIALFVLLEKSVPAGHWFACASGVVLLTWGIWILLRAT